MADTSLLSSFGQAPPCVPLRKISAPSLPPLGSSRVASGGGTGILGTWPSICGEAI